MDILKQLRCPKWSQNRVHVLRTSTLNFFL